MEIFVLKDKIQPFQTAVFLTLLKILVNLVLMDIDLLWMEENAGFKFLTV